MTQAENRVLECKEETSYVPSGGRGEYCLLVSPKPLFTLYVFVFLVYYFRSIIFIFNLVLISVVVYFY